MKELYIVTGASGFLGGVVAALLLQLGKNIRAIDIAAPPRKASQAIEYVQGDVRDKESIRKYFLHDCDTRLIVIHAAGIVSIATKFDRRVYDVNVLGTKNVSELCLEYNARLIYVSTVHAIPEAAPGELITETDCFDPEKVVGLYAKTKAQATQYVLELVKAGLDAVVVHPSGIAGPYDYGRSHVTQLVIDYYMGRLTACVDGGYDFVDVRDVANGIILAAKMGKSGSCYILSNKYFTLTQILDMLQNITHKRPVKTVLPNWFAKLTAPLAELYYKLLKQPPLYTAYSLYTIASNSNFSHEKAIKELGYTTRDMYDTIKDSLSSLKAQGRLEKGKTLSNS